MPYHNTEGTSLTIHPSSLISSSYTLCSYKPKTPGFSNVEMVSPVLIQFVLFLIVSLSLQSYQILTEFFCTQCKMFLSPEKFSIPVLPTPQTLQSCSLWLSNYNKEPINSIHYFYKLCFYHL